MIGETIKYIDVDEYDHQIRVETESGRVFLIYHKQDCCESVRLVDINGNIKNLKGKVIEDFTHMSKQFSDELGHGSKTITLITFFVDDSTVTTRWIGESNGYYSEEISVEEICS